MAVGFADDLARAKAAAGDHRGARFGPVVAAVAAADARSTAELAPQDNGHIVQHIPLGQVGNQRVEADVEQRELLPHVDEVLLVRVPVADLQRDDRNARLDQPAGEQELPAVVAVEIAGLGGLTVEIEGFAGLGGGDDVDGLLGEGVGSGSLADASGWYGTR